MPISLTSSRLISSYLDNGFIARPVFSKGSKHGEIIFRKQHRCELSQRILQGVLAVSCTIAIVPLLTHSKTIKAAWLTAYTGIETKIIGISRAHLPRSSHKQKVHFEEARARKFDKNAVPAEVGQVDSLVLKDLRHADKKQRGNDSDAGEAFFKSLCITSQSASGRKVPPVSRFDTIMQDKKTGRVVSHHGGESFPDFFKDEEILHIGKTLKTEDIGDGIVATFTEHGKAIIQQQSVRGCTAAVVAMLVKDHQGVPDIDALRTTNLGNRESMVRAIKRAKFTPVLRESIENLEQAKALIKENGPFIASMIDMRELGCHVVVVDAISDDNQQVRLRDPWHGWEITVKADAFLKRYSGRETLQIKA